VKKKKLIFEKSAVISRRTKQQQQQQQNKTIMTEQQQQQEPKYCDPPCPTANMMGRSWWKQLGYGSPCLCAKTKRDLKYKKRFEEEAKEEEEYMKTIDWVSKNAKFIDFSAEAMVRSNEPDTEPESDTEDEEEEDDEGKIEVELHYSNPAYQYDGWENDGDHFLKKRVRCFFCDTLTNTPHRFIKHKDFNCGKKSWICKDSKCGQKHNDWCAPNRPSNKKNFFPNGRVMY
jgi:hypothetical protein